MPKLSITTQQPRQCCRHVTGTRILWDHDLLLLNWDFTFSLLFNYGHSSVCQGWCISTTPWARIKNTVSIMHINNTVSNVCTDDTTLSMYTHTHIYIYSSMWSRCLKNYVYQNIMLKLKSKTEHKWMTTSKIDKWLQNTTTTRMNNPNATT